MRRYYPVIAFVLFIPLCQLVTVLAGKEFFLTQLTMSAYYALVIIGLTVLMGYTGQISIGHAAFFAMGGYTAAAVTTRNLLELKGNFLADFFIASGLTTLTRDLYGREVLHVSPWVSLILAVLIVLAVSLLIGIPVLKLKGHYLAMATLGFGIIVYQVLLGTPVFGEADGITNVPPLKLLGLEISGDTELKLQNYYIAWTVLLAGVVLLLNLINSRSGRALRSIHGSEDAAGAMGVNTARYKLFVFVLSAVFAATAGVMLTHFNGGIGPSEAGIMKSVRYVAIVAVGGMANLWGALIMGVFLNFLSLRGYFGSYDDAVFGVILIVIMLFFPDGIFRKPDFRNVRAFLDRWKRGRQPAE